MNTDVHDKVAQFVKTHATACGGNWAAMLMTAIRAGAPDVHASLDPDKNYEFPELYDIIKNIVK